jgi:hypothetical protein
VKSQTISHVQKKPGDSHFWSGLMTVKDSFLSLGIFMLNNGAPYLVLGGQVARRFQPTSAGGLASAEAGIC